MKNDELEELKKEVSHLNNMVCEVRAVMGWRDKRTVAWMEANNK